MATITLRPDKERPVLQHHPWVFSGAIAGVTGYVGRGDTVEVCDARGEWLARGTWSSGSQIRARLFSWNPAEPLDADLLRRRIRRALDARARLPAGVLAAGDAVRLVHAESDGLPGIVVDRYGDVLALQLLTQGAAAHAETIVRLLAEIAPPRSIYERSDAEVRDKESLPPSEGLRWGEPLAERLVIQQHRLQFYVELPTGQKTGFYLDQAVNRARVAAYCAGAEVLDCFCYTGGFSVYAAQAGAAAVTAIDGSAPALALLRDNLALNRLSVPVETIDGDVFRLLRQFRHEGRIFDLVVLDPPKFAHSLSQMERATRGYKDINLIAMQILRPGGILATFSCSGLVAPELFQKIVFAAAIDARRDVQVIERLTQAPDHPVLLTFPEGEYLKGLICRVW
jgi:23S rRNA (cytosine1962-C5)-methyltransferase